MGVIIMTYDINAVISSPTVCTYENIYSQLPLLVPVQFMLYKWPAQRGLVLVGTGGGAGTDDDTGEAWAAGARISALLGGGGGGFLR